MYTYDDKNNMFVYNGDFEEFLISIGVDKTHIRAMQCKILEKDKDKYQEFPAINSAERDYISLVPLNKVIGTSRCSVGWSVYDNVRKMYEGDREPGRFRKCFDYLNNMSLEELKQSYQELCNPVRMIYYVDTDEYYLSGDGNHRTLTAMLIGAEKIKASVTNAYCNLQKKRKCEYVEEFMKKYSIYRIMSLGNRFDITFRDEIGYYEIWGYQGPSQGENLFSFIDKLSLTIDKESKKAKQIKKLPLFVQRIILENDYRLKGYVEKRYLSDNELTFWNYRKPVYLETL